MTITNSSLRLVALVTGVAVALALMGAVAIAPAQAAGLTQTQIQSITSLLASFGADAATIANVTAALNGQATPGTGSGTGGACPALSRSLQMGSDGADVKALQVFLNGSATTQVASAGAGSPGSESTYFGGLTKAAVVKFQSANGVSAIGIVGPATRAAIAAVCGGTPSTPTVPGTTPTTGGAVSVSAGAQPVNSLAVVSASRIPFTTFTLTNNSSAAVTVNSITVQRTGLGVDANFSGIVLLDQNNLQVGTSKTLNSNHQVNIGDTFTLAAGASMAFTVAGNIQTDAGGADAGQVVSLQVVAINTSATVSGSLPINGASHTINTTLTLGSVSTTTSSFDPGAAQSKNIGDVDVRVSGLRFTAGSAEDLKLYSVRWRQVGTASASDIANVVSIVGGTSYPTTLSADGKYYTTIFPGGLLIVKGNSIDLYSKVDLIGSNSASRTVDLDIDKVTDVYFVGQTYGYGIAPSGTATPWFTGYVTTINAGTVTTIGKANEVAAQNIAVNISNQPLGGFATDFKGEAVSVTSLPITIATSSGFTGAGVITSISIVNSNGVVVAGPVDEAATCTTGCTVTFTDTITFPVGRTVYTIKGKINSSVTNNSTVVVTTVPSSWSGVTGVTSGNTITISTGTFDMNTMTVKAAALTVVMSTQPSSQNIVAGVQDVILGQVQLNATQSGEDVRMSSIILTQTGTIGNLSSCRLFNGLTQLNSGGNVPTLAASASDTTFSFDNTLVIPKGTVTTLAIKCNVAAGSTGTHVWSISGSAITATGQTSGVNIAVVETASSGGTMTLASGSLTLSVDSSSPSYVPVAAGSTGVTMGVIKLRPTNEALTLNKLGLTLTSSGNTTSNGAGGTTNLGISDLVQVYLYNSAGSLIGTATFTGGTATTTATSTLTTPLSLAKDVDTLITVKADLANIGVSAGGGIGDVVKVDPLNAETSGASSGSTISAATASGNVSGIRLFKSYPTLALDTLASTGVADGRLMRFKVTANAANPVSIFHFEFKLSTTTGVTVTTVGLYGYSDLSYSSVISGQETSGQIGSSTTTHINSDQFVIEPKTTPVVVPAGQTRYFELRGTVTGVDTGDSIVTTLIGDAAYPTPLTSGYGVSTSTAATSSTVGNYNFVWSGQSTTSSSYYDVDWSNGFGLPGFPSGGLIQSRSN